MRALERERVRDGPAHTRLDTSESHLTIRIQANRDQLGALTHVTQVELDAPIDLGGELAAIADPHIEVLVGRAVQRLGNIEDARGVRP